MDIGLCLRGGVPSSPDAVEVGDNFDAEFCSGGGGISYDQDNDESDAESVCYRRMDDKSDDDDDDGDLVAKKGEVRNCTEWAAWEEEEHGDGDGDDEEQQEDHEEEEEEGAEGTAMKQGGRRDAREEDRAFWRACLAYGYP